MQETSGKETTITPLETKLLLASLQKTARELNRQHVNVLITLDTGGRPAGLMIRKIMHEVYGKSLPLFFINPRFIKAPPLTQILNKFSENCTRHY